MVYRAGERYGKLLLLTALLPLLLCRSAAAQDAVQQPETIRVDVNLVNLRFTIRNADGEFLNTLTADEIRIYENGKRQQIAFFESPRIESRVPEPLLLAFLLDVSGSTFATRSEEIVAARAFLENVHHFTEVGIFGFTDHLIPFQEFTSDRTQALNAFASARQNRGKTAIYSSLDSLISLMNQHAPQSMRKAIIVISDGLDENYRQSSVTVTRARLSEVVIYTVWVPSAATLYINSDRGKTDPDFQKVQEEQQRAFQRLSLATGGRHYGGFETILDFEEVLAKINDEILGNLYTVAYYTDDPYLSRDRRRITVRTSHPEATIHGIYKEVPEQIQAKKRYIEALFDQDAIENLTQESRPLHEIGVQLDLLRQRSRQPSVPFRLKISSAELFPNQTGGASAQFGLIGLLMDMSGREVSRFREVFQAHLSDRDLREFRGVIYTNRLNAPPGDYILKLALLKIPSWKVTVLERAVKIH